MTARGRPACPPPGRYSQSVSVRRARTPLAPALIEGSLHQYDVRPVGGTAGAVEFSSRGRSEDSPRRPGNVEKSAIDRFLEVTADQHQVAALYFYLMLDCLVVYANGVARDFFRRPHFYTVLGTPTIAPDLARLRSLYGGDERVPSQERRGEISCRSSASQALTRSTVRATFSSPTRRVGRRGVCIRRAGL
jgi:hypothetical protein